MRKGGRRSNTPRLPKTDVIEKDGSHKGATGRHDLPVWVPSPEGACQGVRKGGRRSNNPGLPKTDVIEKDGSHKAATGRHDLPAWVSSPEGAKLCKGN